MSVARTKNKTRRTPNAAKGVNSQAPIRREEISLLEDFKAELIEADADKFESIDVDDAGREFIVTVRRKLIWGFLETIDRFVRELKENKGPDSDCYAQWIQNSRDQIPSPRALAQKHKKRRDLRAMIGRGKDPIEASMFFIVNELLNDINFEEEDHWGEGVLKGQMKRRSLRWNADEILRTLEHAEDSRAWFFDPTLASYMKDAKVRTLDLQIALTNLSSLKDRHPKLKQFRACRDELTEHVDILNKVTAQVLDDNRNLFLVIGFCLGLRSYQRELAGKLDGIKLDLMEKFTIGKPAAGGSSAAKQA